MLLLFPLLAPQARAVRRQRWSQQLLAILGLRLEIEGAAPPPGSLIVANHVSWVDIFALNALSPAAFISKAEVRQWPLVGWLAARNDTVFLRRGSRGHARIVNAEIGALLAAGKPVALFPEGTTTDGSHLLGFHAALLQPAVEAGRPVVPVAIRYEDAAGQPSRAPAFAGDTRLDECVLAIVAARGLVVRLSCAPPLATVGSDRRTVSAAAHACIAEALRLTPSSPSPGNLAQAA